MPKKRDSMGRVSVMLDFSCHFAIILEYFTDRISQPDLHGNYSTGTCSHDKIEDVPDLPPNPTFNCL